MTRRALAGTSLREWRSDGNARRALCRDAFPYTYRVVVRIYNGSRPPQHFGNTLQVRNLYLRRVRREPSIGRESAGEPSWQIRHTPWSWEALLFSNSDELIKNPARQNEAIVLLCLGQENRDAHRGPQSSISALGNRRLRQERAELSLVCQTHVPHERCVFDSSDKFPPS